MDLHLPSREDPNRIALDTLTSGDVTLVGLKLKSGKLSQRDARDAYGWLLLVARALFPYTNDVPHIKGLDIRRPAARAAGAFLPSRTLVGLARQAWEHHVA